MTWSVITSLLPPGIAMFLSAASCLNVDRSEVIVHVYINHAEQQTEFTLRRLVWTIMKMWVPGTSKQNGLVLGY